MTVTLYDLQRAERRHVAALERVAIAARLLLTMEAAYHGQLARQAPSPGADPAERAAYYRACTRLRQARDEARAGLDDALGEARR